MLHSVAYSGTEPAFGHEICRIMYCGPHCCERPGNLHATLSPLMRNLSGDMKRQDKL